MNKPALLKQQHLEFMDQFGPKIPHDELAATLKKSYPSLSKKTCQDYVAYWYIANDVEFKAWAKDWRNQAPWHKLAGQQCWQQVCPNQAGQWVYLRR